ITDDEISSGLAPGSDSLTLTVAGSALGNRSTPRSRKEKIPSTTSDMTSIVANTGRRTHSSESMVVFRCSAGLLHRDFRTLGEFVDVGDGDRVARLDAVQDLDALAQPLADLQLARRQPIAVDHE